MSDTPEHAAPDGYERVWVPVAEVPGDLGWDVIDPADARPCRYYVGPNKPCGAPSVVRLNRSHDKAVQRWWHYCEDHLYGRRLRNGHVETRVALRWDSEHEERR